MTDTLANVTIANQAQFNSAVMGWIREATQAIKSCAAMSNCAERHVGQMCCQCEDAYKDLAQQQTLLHHHSLTDEERAAILTAADLMIGSKPGATLRKLLEKLK